MNHIDNTQHHLSFSQAQGYEEIPKQLKLEEFPEYARINVWNCLYTSMKKCVIDTNSGYYLYGDWEYIAQSIYADLFNLPMHEWQPELTQIGNKLYEFIQSMNFNVVFDLIQLVLRHEHCPPDFIEAMKEVFEKSRLAYVITGNQEGPPPTIIPIATIEEGRVLVDSVQTLHQAGLTSAVTHLQESGKFINQGDWVSSIRESVHAVESVARSIAPTTSNNLKTALRKLENQHGQFHPAIKNGILKLYGYASDEPGIRHANLDSKVSNASSDEALLMLGICASIASFLWRKFQRCAK